MYFVQDGGAARVSEPWLELADAAGAPYWCACFCPSPPVPPHLSPPPPPPPSRTLLSQDKLRLRPFLGFSFCPHAPRHCCAVVPHRCAAAAAVARDGTRAGRAALRARAHPLSTARIAFAVAAAAPLALAPPPAPAPWPTAPPPLRGHACAAITSALTARPGRRYNFRTNERSAVAPPLLVALDAVPAPAGPQHGHPAAPAGAGKAAGRLRALTGGGGSSPAR
jgi:hypothetical protein